MYQRAFIILTLALAFALPARSEEHGGEGEFYEDAPEGYQGDDNYNSGYDSNLETQVDLETFNLFEEMSLKQPVTPVAVDEYQAMPAIETTVQFKLRRSSEDEKNKATNVLKLTSAEAKPSVLQTGNSTAPASATATAIVFLSTFPSPVNKLPEVKMAPKMDALLSPPSEAKDQERGVRKFQKVLYVPSNGLGAELPKSAFMKKPSSGFSAQLNRVWNRFIGKSSGEAQEVLPLLAEHEDADFDDELSNVADVYAPRDVSSDAPTFASAEDVNASRFPLWILIVPGLLVAAFFAGRWDTRRRLGVSVAALVRPKESIKEDTFAGTIFHKLK